MISTSVLARLATAMTTGTEPRTECAAIQSQSAERLSSGVDRVARTVMDSCPSLTARAALDKAPPPLPSSPRLATVHLQSRPTTRRAGPTYGGTPDVILAQGPRARAPRRRYDGRPRDGRHRPDGAQDHRPGGARRRLGPDRTLHAAGPDHLGQRQERAGDERARRRRHRRPGAVRQRQGRSQPAPGERLRHGRRHPDQQVARQPRPDDADRAAHRRAAGHRGARRIRPSSRPRTSPRPSRPIRPR